MASQGDESMSLSSAMHKVKRRGFCSIEANSLSSDQEATLALEMREDCELEELDIGNDSGTPESINPPLLQGIHCLQCKIAFYISEPLLVAVNMAHACSGAPGVIKVEEFLG